ARNRLRDGEENQEEIIMQSNTPPQDGACRFRMPILSSKGSSCRDPKALVKRLAICIFVLMQRGPLCSASRPFRSHRIYKISLVVVAMARYSASAEDREITDCFLDFQETGAPPKSRMYLLRDLLVKGHPNQSTSQYVTKFVPPSLGKKTPCPGVAFKYRSTRMTASKWLWRGSDTNWLRTFTGYVISGLVA
ncbi:hypothetical protein Tco_1425172, partial [Tanacetum coccineum]